jgi:predicted permease
MVNVELEVLFNWEFLGAYVGAQGGTMALTMILGMWWFRNSVAEAAINGMNAIYGNTGYMGIPLALAAFGSASTVPTIITVVINGAVVVAVTTVLIEVSQNRAGGVLGIVKDVTHALVSNPMLVAPVLGIAWATTGLGLATPVNNFCQILGAAAGPCALFAIGLFLVGKPISEGVGEVSVNVILKLAVQPVVTWWLAVEVFHLEPLWVTVAVLMAALPTGAGSFVLAQTYQIYVQRTSSAILFSTVVSVLTLSVFFVLFPPSVG